jgi:hypothetical protein
MSAWIFAMVLAHELYSFPKKHGFVFNIAAIFILIIILELSDFIRKKLRENKIKSRI